MSVAIVFEHVKQHKKMSAAAGVVAALAVAGGIGLNAMFDGALKGVNEQLKRAGADKIAPDQAVMGQASFKNTLTGKPGQFEILGRYGEKCFQVAITDGDYTLNNATVTDKSGKVHKVATTGTVCP